MVIVLLAYSSPFFIFSFSVLAKKDEAGLYFKFVGPVCVVDIKLSHTTCVLMQATFAATRTSTPKTQTWWRTSRWTEAPPPRVRSRCYSTHSDRARHPHTSILYLPFFFLVTFKKPQNPSAHSVGSLHDQEIPVLYSLRRVFRCFRRRKVYQFLLTDPAITESFRFRFAFDSLRSNSSVNCFTSIQVCLGSEKSRSKQGKTI